MLPNWKFEIETVIGLDKSGYEIQAFVENEEQSSQKIAVTISL